jgi:CO/xanthine dehydrogenase Mo-binding subunit
LLGFGVAAYVEMTATGAESYGRAGVPVSAADSVSLSLELSGSVRSAVGVSEIGQGVTQVVAQAIADGLGIPAEQVLVHAGAARKFRTAVAPGPRAAQRSAPRRHFRPRGGYAPTFSRWPAGCSTWTRSRWT